MTQILNMHTVQFRVAVVSKNTNSFGLHGVIVMDREGNAWQLGVSYINLPKRGDVVTGWVSNRNNDLYRIVEVSYEIPQKLDQAPGAVAKEVWSADFLKKELV